MTALYQNHQERNDNLVIYVIKSPEEPRSDKSVTLDNSLIYCLLPAMSKGEQDADSLPPAVQEHPVFRAS